MTNVFALAAALLLDPAAAPTGPTAIAHPPHAALAVAEIAGRDLSDVIASLALAAAAIAITGAPDAPHDDAAGIDLSIQRGLAPDQILGLLDVAELEQLERVADGRPLDLDTYQRASIDAPRYGATLTERRLVLGWLIAQYPVRPSVTDADSVALHDSRPSGRAL
jgi:hypothetical protein